MTNHTSTPAGRIACGLTLAAALAAVTGTAPSQAATLQAAGITFPASIPTVHKPMPLFRLVRTAAPASFVEQALGNAHAMSVEGTRLVARDDNGTMHAYADSRTGEAQIFPDFSSSGAAARPAALAQVAATVFARADVIPKDSTQTRLGDPTPVLSATASRTSQGSIAGKAAPQLLFTYVPAVRYAAGLPVVGTGSRATVGVGNDGSIRALVRDWQAAAPAGSVTPTMSSAQIEHAIAAQLLSLAGRYGSATVDSVTPAYYDGDAHYLQPVYQFVATLGSRGSLRDHVRGYVPVGRLAEPLPVIGQNTGGSPPSGQLQGGRHADGNVSQIALGQYVNRECTSGPPNCLDMANAYLNGFDSVAPWVYGPPINRTQWDYAYSYQVLADANSYLNSVNVAYTNPHGDWWLNTTISNYIPTGDPWYVDEIGVGGNPGYGAASGGQLATWIIDSCEVIPSYYDLQYTTGNGNSAFTYWFPVFQGLHRALGFRTQMLLGEDTMNQLIATYMAEGAAADAAFFNGVAGAGTFPTYLDTHLGLTVHYDRASDIHDPRNSGSTETIYQIQGQSASTKLNNVWMGN
jgi:hypothetical protein